MTKEYIYSQNSWHVYYTKTKTAYTEAKFDMKKEDVKACMVAYINGIKLDSYLLSLVLVFDS